MSASKSRTESRSRVESLDEDLMNRPSWAGEPDDRERALSSGRSLQCTSIEVEIPTTTTVRNHIVFKIEISSGGKKWDVGRRFKDFYYLDKQLKGNNPNIKLPSLPPKRYLLSSTDPRFVEERRQQLSVYLKTLVENSYVWNQNDLVLFLDDPCNSMMFIWNFERMRKIRDMLSTMTLKADGAPELNSEFDAAKEQLSTLQERLSRMEMLFLQQATGVAPEPLSDSVIRSLSSNFSSALSSKLAEEFNEETLQDIQTTAAADDVMKAVTQLDITTSPTPNVRESREDIVDVEEVVDAHLNAGESIPAEEVVRVLNMTRDEDADKATKSGDWRAKSSEEKRAVAVSLKLQEALKMSNELLEEKIDIHTTKVVGKSGSRSSLSSALAADSSVDSPLKLARQCRFDVTPSEAEVFGYSANSDVAFSKTPYVSALFSMVDDLVEAISPTVASLMRRRYVFEYIRGIVCSTLALQLFPTGSTLSHTFLPDADFDTTAFFVPKTGSNADSWFVKLNEALCMSAFSQKSGQNADGIAAGEEEAGSISIHNVSFVNTDVKMIRSSINNISVSVSANHVESLYAQALIENIDVIVGHDHLFKRSVLLVKAWCQYESARLSGASGYVAGSNSNSFLSSWAATVMLIWVFNAEGANISHPLQALGHFLKIFSSFDWTNFAVSARGPIPISAIHEAIAGASVQVPAEEEVTAPLSLNSAQLCGVGRLTASYSGPLFFTEEQVSYVSPCYEEHRAYAEQVATAAAAAAETTEEAEKSSPNPHHEKRNLSHTPSGASRNGVFWSPKGILVQNDSTGTIDSDNILNPVGQYCVSRMNIIDPVTCNCNLAKNVDDVGVESIAQSFREGYIQFQGMCEYGSKAAVTAAGISGHDETIVKAVKSLLLNTTIRSSGSLVSIRHQRSEMNAGAQKGLQISTLKSQYDDLMFSVRFAELVLGGKISKSILTDLIIQIIHKKGTMPVGEVGKNLQLITNSDTISRRLKDQFNGLKKAIEVSNSSKLVMGTDHPFNPSVSLVTEDKESIIPIAAASSPDASLMPTFAHASFVFSPVQVAAANQQSTGGKNATTGAPALSQGALASHGGGSNTGGHANISSASSVTGSVKSSTTPGSFRRQPPYYVDRQMYKYQQQQMAGSPRVGGSTRTRQQQQQHQQGFFGAGSPPQGAMVYGSSLPPMPMALDMYQQQMQMNYIAQKQIYDNYQAQMMMQANSAMSNASLSSSPMGSQQGISVSPATASFMTGLLQEDPTVPGSTPPMGNIMFYQPAMPMMPPQPPQPPQQQDTSIAPSGDSKISPTENAGEEA